MSPEIGRKYPKDDPEIVAALMRERESFGLTEPHHEPSSKREIIDVAGPDTYGSVNSIPSQARPQEDIQNG
ncbi:MAG: hypothetical protein U0451_02080 [Candidatus Saccharimonadales bacterium]